jgi:hypothetical protein
MNSFAMFEFTEEDLKSNKRGFFSASQKEVIRNYADGIRKSQQGGLKVVVFFLFLGLCMLLGMFLSSESYRALLFSDPTILIVLVTIVPVVLGIFALSIYGAHRRADRFLNSELKKVEGIARLDEEHSSKVGSTYYVIVNKIKFALPEDASGVFQDGESYRIFYCETSMLKYLLSFEKIETNLVD